MVAHSRFSAYVRRKVSLFAIAGSISAGVGFSSGAIAAVNDPEHQLSSFTDVSGAIVTQRIAQRFDEGGSSQASGETLAFSTERYSVRVYRQNNQLFMDLLDRQSQRAILQRSSTALIAPANTFWRTYRSASGSVEVFARNDPNGNTELEIFSGGQPFYFGRGSINGGGQPTTPGGGNTAPASALLSFDTNDYRVRVYRPSNQIVMDLIDVRSNAFLINQSPTAIAPQQQTVATSRTYVTTQGAYQVFASVNSNRATELQLWSNGNQVYRGAGFNAAGSDLGFGNAPSTGFFGNDFAVPAQARITARTANLRDRTSTNGTIVATLLQCTLVTATQKQYNTADRHIWYFIDIPGQARGWIRGDLVDVNSTAC
ncbi:MAG: SH3 domain-containing protein [Cyanobacteria bacterium J06627_8]